ncbi:MAG TPA: EAL domain-containing protein [Gemmatimonadales bacterium]|nr:EAL domain-containing protein [Gemmatimonadales bacterium]
MTPADLLVLLLRSAAFIWSVVLLRRSRDRRIGLLGVLLLLLVVDRLVIPAAGPDRVAWWPAMLVSVAALVLVVFLGRWFDDHRRATEALRIEKAYFEHLFANAPESMLLADAQGHIERVNAEFTRLFGYSADEVRGQSLDEILAPHALAEARVLTSDSAHGRTVRFETQRRRRDGSLLHVSIIGSPIVLEGRQLGVYALYRDNTPRVRAEEALRTSDRYFRSLMANTLDLIVVLDTDGRVRYTSGSIETVLGYDTEELLGRDAFGLLHPDEVDEVRGRFVRLLDRPGPAPRIEFRCRHHDGAWRIFEASANNLLADPAIDGVVITMRDIAARKRAEEALRESEERYALAQQGANDGLWDWDLRAGQVYFSPRWKAMVGAAEHEVGTAPEEWFGRVHPDELEQLKIDIDLHVAGHTPHLQTEHRMRHRDGLYRWVMTRGLAVRDAAGKAYRLAGSQTDITVRKSIEEQLLHDAFHDPLTGLPNRALFMDRMGHAIRRGRRSDGRSAVLFLDLDRFKVVNDSLGHVHGDQLLVAIARRLEDCIRPGDTVGRLGGDEFVVLLDEVPGAAGAEEVAGRIQAALSDPFELAGQEVFVTASIGIAISVTGHERAEDLLRDADTAMYDAKAQGKATHRVFHAGMHSHAMSQLQLETDLRRALDREELVLFYQPIVSLARGRVTGFEALARWRHPERGFLGPEEFIPLAEETGLIDRIGQWVMGEACRTLRGWLDRHPASGPLSVSVNISARQFQRPELVAEVAAVLAEVALPSGALRLEITEGTIMGQAESSVAVLRGLKQAGVQVQVDDFGTGYSSLSYLQRFQLDALKIDRSFVGELGNPGENPEIVRTIIALAKNLGMAVIAEGVETPRQRTMLQQFGCDYVQGWLFSHPLDREAAEALLDAEPAVVPPRSG